MKTLKEKLQSINNGQILSTYLLLGDDYFLQEFFVSRLEKHLNTKRTVFNPDDISTKEILEQLSNNDLFSSTKLFVVRDTQKFVKKQADELLDLCRNPLGNHYIILIADDFYTKSKLIEQINSVFEGVDCRSPFEDQLENWIKYFFKNENIEAPPSVVKKVLELAGDSTYHCFNLVTKICISLDEGEMVTPERVETFSGWNRQFKPWQLHNKIGERDIWQSIMIGKDLISRLELIALIPQITALFQEMLFVHLDKGTYRNFRGYTLLNKSIQSKVPNFSKNYTKQEIENALIQLGEIDELIKTTRVNNESLFYNFICSTVPKNG